MYVAMCVHVYVCTHMCGGTHVPVHMSRAKGECQLFSLLLSEPGTHCFPGRLAATKLGHPPVPLQWDRFWERKLRSLRLHEKHSYALTHLSTVGFLKITS